MSGYPFDLAGALEGVGAYAAKGGRCGVIPSGLLKVPLRKL